MRKLALSAVALSALAFTAVVHGHDLNGNGTYDGPLSSLSSVIGAPVPLEAELPVACGALSGSSRTFG